MSKRLVDIDDGALESARNRLGTTTIKDTVNEALRRATGSHEVEVADAFDVLAGTSFPSRDEAWR